MIRHTAILTLFLLPLPTLAQGLPALVGEGSQTQTVEAAKGAVVVSVESGGDISLGGADPSLGGGVSVSVNGLSVGLGSRDSEAAPSAGLPANHGSQGERPSGASAGTAASGAPISRTDAANCTPAVSATDDAVRAALAADLPVYLRSVDCAAEDLSDLAIPAVLSSRLLAAGIEPEQVVSITLMEAGLIVDFSAAR